jgi:diguanylate cyclase (GGDEF)-like protein
MRKKRILVVDDEEDLLQVLDKRLTTAGYEVFKATSGERILEMVRDVMPDLILLDILMPGVDGMQVKAKLDQDVSTDNIPVIFLTARSGVSDKISGLGLGADDYITKPFNTEELLARVGSVLSRRDFYERISMTDGLTGLYNINFFQKQLAIFFNIARRYKKIFSLAIIDIDNLKHINDTFGHAAGDFVLKMFGSIAKETLRKSDIITRYGGDEFAVIMPEADNREANNAGERLKSNINGKALSFEDNRAELTVSISAGVVTYEDTIKDESQMFKLADTRLYEDKSKDKNE